MNIGEFGFFGPKITATWKPEGDYIEVRGGKSKKTKKNPFDKWTDAIAGRLFVGLNVNDEPTWDPEEVVEIVKRWRTTRGLDPSGSFIAQKGVYRSKKSGKTTTEQSVQVVIFPDGSQGLADFQKDMVKLGEHLCQVLEQESVILEIQKNGATVTVGMVTP